MNHKSSLSILIYSLIIFQSAITFAQQSIFSDKQLITEGRVWDVAFDDLNKDGSSDLVIANWFKPPTIYFNNGKGGFESIKPLPCSAGEEGVYRGHCVGVSDFNKDKSPDIFYVFNGRNNLIYSGDNNEFRISDTINTSNADGLYISLGDTDNDQDIDAFVTNYNQPTVLWTNDGEGKFEKNNTDFGSNGYNTDLGDLNNDGNLDVICSINGKVVVWFNQGNNVYDRSNQFIGYAEGYGRVKLADIDNDKDLDIVLANKKAGGSIWLNDGSGVFSEGTINLTKSSAMVVGDIDLNGHKDAIFGKTIWLNNGHNQFIQHGILEFEGIEIGLWLNDIDNDKDLDLFYSTSIRENSLVLITNTTR